jgi:hypothetical protein
MLATDCPAAVKARYGGGHNDAIRLWSIAHDVKENAAIDPQSIAAVRRSLEVPVYGRICCLLTNPVFLSLLQHIINWFVSCRS